MYSNPAAYYGNPEKIDQDIALFFEDHGFNGFHIQVFCRWFDIEQERYDGIDTDDPNPDLRTFEALETLITRVYAAGGSVHIWAWGDQSRHQTPVKWGINGDADQRLQRYIAARLGPLPGWTMGYGFDLWEWVEEQNLRKWHEFMHEHFMVPHSLGARSQKNEINQIYMGMDYSSYEQHRPDYEKYVETIEHLPGKPSFSEDRFRIRESERYREKDYTMELTRRGLYHSTMAGGVANIWGHLLNSPDGEASGPYPRPEWIKTYSTFFFEKDRFIKELIRDNSVTDGYCLRTPDYSRVVIYKENTSSVYYRFRSNPDANQIVAVDCKRPYEELELDLSNTESGMITLPYSSDWILAFGKF
ncbi:MAG: hypothetical protein GF372_01345 [Candidatus Marinimicrobia bacterium]|nr:hypothetical protein [Candidatus Neomarinimicrobiota bacterium]